MPVHDVECLDEVLGEWPQWSGQVAAGVGLALCVWVAAGRHAFTRPGLAIVPIAMIAVPWLFDLLRDDPLMARWPRGSLVAWSALAVGCLAWLLVGFPT